MTAVVRSVEMLFPHYQKRVFFSVMADKDYSSMLHILKRNSLSFTFYQADRTRGKKAEDLANEWKKEYDGEIHIAKSLEEGLAFNLEKMKKENGRTLLLFEITAKKMYKASCTSSPYSASGDSSSEKESSSSEKSSSST